ncbi:MAG TPA: hypothetical protein VFV95_07640 [Vicinamibacterales bacterium]|nr:hypothetical protein [Vicinamibacterales bacterium]
MRILTSVLVSLAAIGRLTAQRLLTWDTSLTVYELDVATGTRTLLGSVTPNVGVIGGAAYDRLAGKIFVTGPDNLFFIDITNGAASLVGSHGLSVPTILHGLEWDSSTDTLYGVAVSDNRLYTIDRTTGLATLVGPTGLAPGSGNYCNLGHHAAANVMLLTNSGTASTYTVDRTTGLATLLGPLNGPTSPTGLAFDSDNGLMYLVDNLSDTLYTVDPVSGAATAVGSMGPGNSFALAYIPGAGRLTRTFASCGATPITVTGHPNLGYTIQTTLGNVAGVPLIGLGVTSLSVVFCGCPIGHEWAVAIVGSTASLPIPAAPGLVGAQVFIQGIDFLAPGGCPDPQHTMTDTITLTVG